METGVAIIAALAGVTALFLAYWLGWPGKRVAERQLSVTRSLKIELNGTEADHCVWVLPWDAAGTAFMIELDLTLTNEGNRSVEDITVELDMPSLAYIPEFNRDPGGAARLARVEQATDPVEGTERTKVFFKVPAVHPNVAVHVSDYLFLPFQSRHQDFVEATTKDNVPVRAKYEFVFGWAIRVAVSARDLSATRGKFAIFSFSPDDQLLAPLAESEGAVAKLAKALSGSEKPEMVSAAVFTPREIDHAPVEIAQSLGVSLRRARLRGTQMQFATYLKGIGYLPLKMEAEG